MIQYAIRNTGDGHVHRESKTPNELGELRLAVKSLNESHKDDARKVEQIEGSMASAGPLNINHEDFRTYQNWYKPSWSGTCANIHNHYEVVQREISDWKSVE